MAASDNVNNLQFRYSAPEMGFNYHSVDTVLRREGDRVTMARMSWNSKRVLGIDVPPEFRRQGIATALWNEGHRLASENQRVPAPKHSSDRTPAGDAWARSVGGPLPRRSRKSSGWQE